MHPLTTSARTAMLAALLSSAGAHAGIVSTLDAPSAVPLASSAGFDGLKDLALRGELDALIATPAAMPALPSAGATRNEIGSSSYDVSLAIWHCIRAIRAQRDSRSIELIESRMALINATLPAVAAVPLPAAAWFMLMGLLGLAGARITRGDRRGAAETSGSAAPVPAAA